MRKFRGFVGLLAVAALVATACTSPAEEEEVVTPPEDDVAPPGEWSLAEAAEPYRGTSIRVLDEISDLQPTFYEELVPLFEQETGIEVEVDIQGHFDVITVGEADLFAGTGTFDAVMLHSWQLPNSLEAQAIEPLDQYVENPALRDPSVSPENFIRPPGGGDEVTVVGGQRWAFNNWNYNQVWIGRKDLLDHPDEQAAFQERYGYDLAPPQTLEQMRDIGEFFTRSPGETLGDETLTEPVFGFIQEGARLGATWSDVWINYINQFGGELFDEAGTPIANRPENVPGLEFWKSIFEFAPPGASEISLVDLPVVLGEGQAVTGIAWSDFFWTVDSEGESRFAGNFTYAPIPPSETAPDLHQVNNVPSFNVINAASENKEATFLFLQWMVSPQTQDAWLDIVANQGRGGFDPVLTSSFENPLYSQGPRAELLAAIEGSVRVGRAYPHLAGFPRYQDPMLQRFQEFLLGQSTAEETLEALQADFEAVCTSNCLIEVP